MLHRIGEAASQIISDLLNENLQSFMQTELSRTNLTARGLNSVFCRHFLERFLHLDSAFFSIENPVFTNEHISLL